MASGKIYLFSNVPYPEDNKLKADPEDTLVFLNAATSIDYYSAHVDRVVYHRRPMYPPKFPLRIFGEERLCVLNRYVYDAGLLGIPTEFLQRLEESYDYNYSGVPDKVKSPTTGYIVAKYLQHENPEREVVLVNFGSSVTNSTFRSPVHNWEYEDRDLACFLHASTE